MSENLVPYGVGFASGAGFVMIRNILKKKNAQDGAVGLSYSKKSSPCREEPVEEEPLTEATYVDMNPTYTNWPPVLQEQDRTDSVVECTKKSCLGAVEDEPLTATYVDMFINWPPGAVLHEQEQQQHMYEKIEYSSIRPEQEQQQHIYDRADSVVKYTNWPPRQQQHIYRPKQEQQQHVYEPIEYPAGSVVEGAVSRQQEQQQYVYEPRADVERK